MLDLEIMKRTQMQYIDKVSSEKSFSNGVAIVELSNVTKFAKFFVDNFVTKEKFVFRGQSKAEWEIVSSFQRLAGKKVKKCELKRHLDKFKYASRGRRGPNPNKLSDTEWWVMGQHYGLATPLVDWTRSYWVALFFAFNDRIVETDSRSVYALDLKWVKEMGKNAKGKIKVIDPILDENTRLITQAALSIQQQPVQHSFEEAVKKHCSEPDRVILVKVIMPNKDVDYCVKDLDRMNINHLALFPDLTGASEYANTVFDVGIGKGV